MDFEAVVDVRIRRADPVEIDVLTAIDDDAAMLFMQAGINVDFPPDHEFLAHERLRLGLSLAAGTALLATHRALGPVGFVALGCVDGQAYIEQLSVRMQAMRRGIGTLLLGAVAVLAKANGESTISLTTYGHLPWNRRFYEYNGYAVVPEMACGVELARELEFQRRWLPRPDQRVAMRKTLGNA
jgi:GNAT superfamily N-acetyltransferase